jgi:hypothetical protein
MLTNPFHQISRRTPREYARGFVQEASSEHGSVRNPRVERLLGICWILIALKCAVVAWAVRHYCVPFNALWVIGPTVIFAALVSAVYWWRD